MGTLFIKSYIVSRILLLFFVTLRSFRLQIEIFSTFIDMYSLRRLYAAILLLCTSSIALIAQTFESEGLWYSVASEGEVMVILNPDQSKYALSDVVIPERVVFEDIEYAVTQIDDYAFQGCTDIVSLIISKSVVNIGASAFDGCTGMKFLRFADGTTPLSFENNRQFMQSPLDSLVVGRDLDYASGSRAGGYSPFASTSREFSPIKYVEFTDSVTSIPSRLFERCTTIEKVFIGQNVTSIADNLFRYCTALKVVVCKTVTPPSSRRSIITSDNSVTLYVPEGTAEAYQATTSWKDFYRILDIEYVPDFIIDGVKYSLVAKGNVGVVAINDTTKYEGNIVLPETVSCNGTTYTVTVICNGAFNDCQNLVSVQIPASVSLIEDYAFQNCSIMVDCEAVTPPVCSEKSFNEVSGRLFVPEGTHELYSSAIGWSNFTYLIDCEYIPDFNVDGIVYTLIGRNKVAVSGCDESLHHLKHISLPETVEYKGVVYQLTEIIGMSIQATFETIDIPNAVTAIRPYAFSHHEELKSIILPDSLVVLGEGAFSGCYDLSHVTIPAGVKIIERETFSSCNLDTVVVKGVEPPFVKVFAFDYDIEYATLIVPNGTFQAYMNAMHWQDFYKIEEVEGYANIFEIDGVRYKMDSYDGTTVCVVGATVKDVIIPDSVLYNKKFAVTAIADNAFAGNRFLESIVISEGVVTLGSLAFDYCDCLRSIHIPSTLVNGSFGYEYNLNFPNYGPAFRGCTGLESITVAEGHPNLDSRNNCNALIWTNKNWNGVELLMGCKNTVLFDGITQIADNAFYDTGIKEVDIPNSVTRIGSGAFQLCDSLQSVRIGSGLTQFALSNHMGNEDLREQVQRLFQGCYNLKTIVVDENNPLIDSRNNCNAIIETATNTILLGSNGTVIPESVTAVSLFSFELCSELKELYIPEGLTNISYGSFFGCNSLEKIVVSELNSVYDSRNNCNAIIETATDSLISGCMNTIIPEDVVFIGHYAFGGNHGLKSIVIPDAVHTIGQGAFTGCRNLRSITIGKGLKTLLRQAFGFFDSYIIYPRPVYRLNTIVFKGDTPPAFDNINSSGFDALSQSYIQLVVPAGTYDAYKSADVWKDFSNITEGEGVAEFEQDGICYHVVLGGNNATVMPLDLDDELNSDYRDSIVIPETVWYDNNEYVVTTIGDFAFFNCYDLNYLSIPATVNEIRRNGLATYFTYDDILVCYATTPPVYRDFSLFADATLRIPRASFDLYKKAYYWTHFWGYEEAPIEAIEDFTGIGAIDSDIPSALQNAIFDFSGRRITNTNNLAPGIYIINGKKVLIK